MFNCSYLVYEHNCICLYIVTVVGIGVFAAKKLEAGRFLFMYEGEKLSEEEGERRLEDTASSGGSYIFFFPSKNGILR